MRWTLRISFLLFLAWAIFMVSPFVALYDLARAVETKDLARIEERVNFRALGVSLSRQIVGAYLDQQDLGGLDRQLATEAGASALNPVVAELLTPQSLADLLENGRLQKAVGGGNAAVSPLKFDVGSLKEAFRVFIASQSQGFRVITIPLPAGQPEEKQFRLTFRLSHITWRLVGIDLPKALREDLKKRASLAMK